MIPGMVLFFNANRETVALDGASARYMFFRQ